MFIHYLQLAVSQIADRAPETTVKEAAGTVLFALVLILLYQKLKVIYLCWKLNAEVGEPMPHDGWVNSRPALFMLNLKTRGELVEYLWKIWYGDNENYHVKVGGGKMFVTTDPENLKALLATQFNDFELGIRHSHFKPLLGDGIFTLDNDGWKHLRAVLRPNFSREKIGHLQSLEFHLLRLFKHIRNSNGEPFDLQELFFKFTVDTSTEFLFGSAVDCLSDKLIGEHPVEKFEGHFQFYDAFNASQAICLTRAWLQYWYWLCYPPSFRKNNKIVHNFADYYVNHVLSMSPEELDKASNGYTFLYELVKESRDPKFLRDQALNIMIAGRDTTAGLMSFSFYELSKRPDIWAKLKAEIYEKFGLGEDARIEDITFESLKRCQYLKNFINEVLRMYPSVPINYRFANKHTTLPRGGGHASSAKPVLIQKGEPVGYVIAATHRNEKYYGKDAHVFRPERWEDRNLKPGWAFLPFNGGPRICLGQQFAITEAMYVILRIAQQFPNIFDHDKEPHRYPPRMVAQLTSSLATGCWVALQE